MTKLYLTVSDLAWHEVKEYSAKQAIRMVIPKHSGVSPLDPYGIGLDRNLTKELERFPTQERNECLRMMEYFTRDTKMRSLNTVIKHPKNEERPVDFTSVTPTHLTFLANARRGTLRDIYRIEIQYYSRRVDSLVSCFGTKQQ